VGGLAEGLPQTPPYEWWIWHDEPSPDSDRPAGATSRLSGPR
jgi:hypothetical protein